MIRHHFPSDREIVIVRTFNAPVARVWAAYTGPDVDRWWGPNGFVTTTESRDFRVGGEWRYTMAHPTWGTFPNFIRYDEIVPQVRIRYRHSGDEHDPVEAFNTIVSFAAVDGGTELTLHTILPNPEALQAALKYNAVEGGKENLQRFADAFGFAE